jgi:hypothetical protein
MDTTYQLHPDASELAELLEEFWDDLRPEGLVLESRGGTATEEDESASEDEDTDTDDDSGDDDSDAGDESDEDDDGDEDLSTAERDELNRLRREAADRSRASRKNKNKQAKTESDLRNRLESESKRADDAEEALQRFKQVASVEKVAKRLKAVYPDSIAKELTDEEMTDEKSIERGLKRVKREKPRLFDEQRRSGGDISDDDDPPGGGEAGQQSGGQYGFDRLRGVKRKNN